MYHRWMEAGETIEVDKAPSYFGTIHFIIESKSDRVILRLDNLYSYPPAFIEFSIPFFIKKVLVDEKEIEINKASTFRFDPFAREVIVYR
jgi:hypothetical protein